MLVVTIELHSAVTGKITQLGKAIISNVGGTVASGDYAARFGRKHQQMLPDIHANPCRSSEVKSFPRRRLNAWHLLARALNAAGYGK